MEFRTIFFFWNQSVDFSFSSDLKKQTNPTICIQENSDMFVKALKLNAVLFLIKYLLGLL